MPAGRVGLLSTVVGGSVGKFFSNISTTQHFKVFCMGKLKLWCIREVKIHCVKPFPCILFWKDEFNRKVCELVDLDCLILLVMFVGSKSFPGRVEEKLYFLRYDAVYVANTNISEDLHAFLFCVCRPKSLLVLLGRSRNFVTRLSTWRQSRKNLNLFL